MLTYLSSSVPVLVRPIKMCFNFVALNSLIEPYKSSFANSTFRRIDLRHRYGCRPPIYSFMIEMPDMKVGIPYPSSQSARFITGKLLESGYKVVFYCPEAIDVEAAENMITEFHLVGLEQDELRITVDSFTVQKDGNMTDCEMISKFLQIIHYIVSST